MKRRNFASKQEKKWEDGLDFALMGHYTHWSYKKVKVRLFLAQYQSCIPSFLIILFLLIVWSVSNEHLQETNFVKCHLNDFNFDINFSGRRQNCFIMFSCKQNNLHKSNVLLLSNNIPLLSLNLLSSHWGCVVAELYIAQLYVVLLRRNMTFIRYSSVC